MHGDRVSDPARLRPCRRRRTAPDRASAFADCDQQQFASYGLEGQTGPSRYHQGPGQIGEFWITEVDGSIVIIDVTYRPSTPAALIEEMRDIAESATFK